MQIQLGVWRYCVRQQLFDIALLVRGTSKINITRVSNDINVCSPARFMSRIAGRNLMKFGISVVSLEK